MEPYLRGMFLGLFLGFGVGVLFATREGWPSILAGVSVIAVLATIQYIWYRRQSQEAPA